MVTLDTALFVVGLVTEAAVLALLLFRRSYKTLPVFSLYLAWSVINDIGVFFLSRHFPISASRIYLVDATVDAILMFCILIELSMSVLEPIRNHLPRFTVLKVAGVVLCLCGLVWLFTKPSANSDLPIKQLISHMVMTTATVRVVFFVVLAALSQFLSLGWRDREFQIASGFGFYSLASLLVELVYQNPALWNSPTVQQLHRLDQVASASYLLSMVYWLYNFAHEKAARREFTPQMHNLLLALAGNARDTRIAMTTRSSASKSDPRFRG